MKKKHDEWSKLDDSLLHDLPDFHKFDEHECDNHDEKQYKQIMTDSQLTHY